MVQLQNTLSLFHSITNKLPRKPNIQFKTNVIGYHFLNSKFKKFYFETFYFYGIRQACLLKLSEL